jgi:4-diphosphocytidyl-2-C-methyl-D-erythritol kinase
MRTRVRSFSKINLGIAVGPIIPGTPFHALTTCYQTLAAHDVVTVTLRPWPGTVITLTCNHSGVPCTKTGDADKNTAYRIVERTLEEYGVTANVHIDIDKRLPVQGGLGAGSANAAAAMIALEKELAKSFGIDLLPLEERLALAAEIGSDVPLFLIGGTVLGTGHGELVSELPDLPEMHCVLAIPSVGVSTKQAFADLDAKMQGSGNRGQGTGTVLTDPCLLIPEPLRESAVVDKLEKLSHALAGAFGATSPIESGPSGIVSRTSDLAENPLLSLVRTGIENDFEEVAFSQHPSLRSTKRDLMGSGPEAALYAALSGSGSALFGLYANETGALAAQQRVQASGTEAIVTKTLARPGYWHTMFAE